MIFYDKVNEWNFSDIDYNLIKVLTIYYQNIDISVKHSTKSARGNHNGFSHQRSSYVGFLRNKCK